MNIEILNNRVRRFRGRMEYDILVDEYNHTIAEDRQIINTLDPNNFGGFVLVYPNERGKHRLTVIVYID